MIQLLRLGSKGTQRPIHQLMHQNPMRRRRRDRRVKLLRAGQALGPCTSMIRSIGQASFSPFMTVEIGRFPVTLRTAQDTATGMSGSHFGSNHESQMRSSAQLQKRRAFKIWTVVRITTKSHRDSVLASETIGHRSRMVISSRRSPLGSSATISHSGWRALTRDYSPFATGLSVASS